MSTAPETFNCPVPEVRPFGVKVQAKHVQDVWDAFVRPVQEGDLPQSVEMRCLMAILRAVYSGLTTLEAK